MSADADLNVWLETVLPGLLPGFLPERRWFAGKARRIRTVGLEDAVWLPNGHRPHVLVVVAVQYADGGRERYALLLAFVQQRSNLPVVGRLEGHGTTAWAVEGTAEAEGGRALLRGFVSSPELPTLRGGRLRYADASEAVVAAVASAAERGAIRPVGAEQSNTSLRVDQTLVFKLFRKLDEGENPELEVGRFLSTRTSFRATPKVQGSLTYTSAGGVSATVGVLQDWVENRGDGWSYVVGQLRQPLDAAAGDVLLRDLSGLGMTTADFHAALAGDAAAPGFAPEEVTSSDVQAWQGDLAGCATRCFALVERTIQQWPEATRRMGQSLLDLLGRSTLPQTPEIATKSAKFCKIRVHGDYHLGQTLKTADGFVLIDFEGEPARPLAERRQKHSALKDVAGMIRSFDYVIEAVRQECPDEDSGVLSGQRLRESFLEGYLSAAATHRAVFLPEDRRVLDAWIDFFEVEKALYELDYEINNRPAWVHIPLRGVLRILGGQV